MRFLAFGTIVLLTGLVTVPAGAQSAHAGRVVPGALCTGPCDEDFVHAGVFPTVERALARGARVVDRADRDLDHDGVADAVLGVAPRLGGTGESATVYAFHRPGGWSLHVIFIDMDMEHHALDVARDWGQPGEVFVVLHDQESLDVQRDHSYVIQRFDLGGATIREQVVFAGTTRSLETTWAFEGLPDHSVLQTVETVRDTDDHPIPVQYRRLVLTVDARTLRPSAWFTARADATAAPPLAPPVRACLVSLAESFHLRPTETLQTGGPEYPPTEVEILHVGTLLRRATHAVNIRVLRDGYEGWIFLAPEALPAGCTR